MFFHLHITTYVLVIILLLLASVCHSKLAVCWLAFCCLFQILVTTLLLSAAFGYIIVSMLLLLASVSIFSLLIGTFR